MTLLHITYDKVRVTFNVKHFGTSQSASDSASQSVLNALSVDFGFLLSIDVLPISFLQWTRQPDKDSIPW